MGLDDTPSQLAWRWAIVRIRVRTLVRVAAVRVSSGHKHKTVQGQQDSHSEIQWFLA
jgi:hypothetical protein